MSAAIKRRPYCEATIIRALAHKTFSGHLCCVDNCNALGSECDLLVIAPCLRAIDVEVKISRADLRADRKKDKWHREEPGSFVGGRWQRGARVDLEWPRGVWKHYYAIAADIWRPELLDEIRPGSGVLVVELTELGYLRTVRCERKARCDKNAKPLGVEMLCKVARLASLRLWDQQATGWRGTGI